MNNVIPWKSSGWKHLPDPICKSVLGRDAADGISHTQHWAVAEGTPSSKAGHSQTFSPCVPPLGMPLGMMSGHFGENWGDALRRKELDVVSEGRSSENLVVGAPLHPQINVDGASGTDRDPLQSPRRMWMFSESSKDPSTPWHGCHWHRATSTCLAAHEGRMLLALPCQGSSNQPSRELAAANTPLFTKHSWVKALGLHQLRQQILRKAKGIFLPLPACGMEWPLLLCPCCRGRAVPPAGPHGAY